MAEDSGGGGASYMRPRLEPAPGTFIDRRTGNAFPPYQTGPGGRGILGRLGTGIRVPVTGLAGGIQGIRGRARGKSGGRKGRKGKSR